MTQLQNKTCPQCRRTIASHLRLCPCGYDFVPQFQPPAAPVPSAALSASQWHELKRLLTIFVACFVLVTVILAFDECLKIVNGMRAEEMQKQAQENMRRIQEGTGMPGGSGPP